MFMANFMDKIKELIKLKRRMEYLPRKNVSDSLLNSKTQTKTNRSQGDAELFVHHAHEQSNTKRSELYDVHIVWRVKMNSKEVRLYVCLCVRDNTI